ncbi:MAG TPA: hypothetical protein VEH81_09700, partial [Ktedonobacteraceae bacterium]|nr:hypothetical protein [Ktedonobacteraceae bacterium]
MKSGKQNSNWRDAQASRTVPVKTMRLGCSRGGSFGTNGRASEREETSSDESANSRAKCEVLGLDRDSRTAVRITARAAGGAEEVDNT